MLRQLYQVGFDDVVATPHMRPGMFDNDRDRIERAFAAMQPTVSASTALPTVHLASEHFFDDIVFGRLVRGEALPYGRSSSKGTLAPPPLAAVLVEFGAGAFPVQAQHRFFDLRRAGLVPVLAHPERYEPVWKRRRVSRSAPRRGCSSPARRVRPRRQVRPSTPARGREVAGGRRLRGRVLRRAQTQRRRHRREGHRQARGPRRRGGSAPSARGRAARHPSGRGHGVNCHARERRGHRSRVRRASGRARLRAQVPGRVRLRRRPGEGRGAANAATTATTSTPSRSSSPRR